MPVAPGSLPYLDLCFILINGDKVTILSRYMAYFLEVEDETLIIIIMLLIDDIINFKKVHETCKYQCLISIQRFLGTK